MSSLTMPLHPDRMSRTSNFAMRPRTSLELLGPRLNRLGRRSKGSYGIYGLFSSLLPVRHLPPNISTGNTPLPKRRKLEVNLCAAARLAAELMDRPPIFFGEGGVVRLSRELASHIPVKYIHKNRTNVLDQLMLGAINFFKARGYQRVKRARDLRAPTSDTTAQPTVPHESRTLLNDLTSSTSGMSLHEPEVAGKPDVRKPLDETTDAALHKSATSTGIRLRATPRKLVDNLAASPRPRSKEKKAVAQEAENGVNDKISSEISPEKAAKSNQKRKRNEEDHGANQGSTSTKKQKARRSSDAAKTPVAPQALVQCPSPKTATTAEKRDTFSPSKKSSALSCTVESDELDLGPGIPYVGLCLDPRIIVTEHRKRDGERVFVTRRVRSPTPPAVAPKKSKTRLPRAPAIDSATAPAACKSKPKESVSSDAAPGPSSAPVLDNAADPLPDLDPEYDPATQEKTHTIYDADVWVSRYRKVFKEVKTLNAILGAVGVDNDQIEGIKTRMEMGDNVNTAYNTVCWRLKAKHKARREKLGISSS